MRFACAATVFSTLFISAVSASSLEARQSPFPTCATSCIEHADLGGCVASDSLCTCKNQAFVSSVTDCIYASCEGSDLTSAVSTAQAICAAVGVTLTSTPVLTSTAAGASATGNSNRPANITSVGSKTGTASASSATATNAASSNSHSLTLAGVLGIIAISFSLA
ncbi:hypothetical protein AX14_004734 [Amanita brunnescens Koide BX004]|nr:hypothetical protein AX14_004734 [Amanita brunnescens Koide BX004]